MARVSAYQKQSKWQNEAGQTQWLFETVHTVQSDVDRHYLQTLCATSTGLTVYNCGKNLVYLVSWDGFPAQQLRRIDANVYDNDRYDSNLSPYHKLYIYSHVLSQHLASAPKEVGHKKCSSVNVQWMFNCWMFSKFLTECFWMFSSKKFFLLNVHSTSLVNVHSTFTWFGWSMVVNFYMVW